LLLVEGQHCLFQIEVGSVLDLIFRIWQSRVAITSDSANDRDEAHPHSDDAGANGQPLLTAGLFVLIDGIERPDLAAVDILSIAAAQPS
jgi:hypothetical protein